ncbi:MAG: hypothetical protein JJE52_15945 [Acidimicrobiia bacterium]|nr:hypothetical protein [Acidimicrobiia bacterium]
MVPVSTSAPLRALVVRDLRESLAVCIDSARASSMTAADAVVVVAEAARIENAAVVLKALAARRLAETGAWRNSGDRSPAHYLARVSGTSVGAARTVLDTCSRLDHLPATAAAARCGELSMRQAAAISDAALVDRAAEGRLLRMAKSGSLSELEEECARVKAAACPDDEAERHRRARAERGCHTSRRADRSAQILYRSSADEVAEIWSVIRSFTERRFAAARGAGVRDTHDNYCADGMLDMARTAAARTNNGTSASPGPDPAPATPGRQPRLPLDDTAEPARSNDPGPAPTPTPTPAGPTPLPAKVIVRIDWDALMRGYPTTGETCEIAGLGPVPVSAIRHLLDTNDPFIAVVLTKGTDVVTVAHHGRKPTAHQRTALEWMTPRCRAQGCNRTIGLQVDHEIPWAQSKITLLAHLDWLCTHHHDLKSHKGWSLTPGNGTRPLVPPDDPRHPHHGQANPSAPPVPTHRKNRMNRANRPTRRTNHRDRPARTADRQRRALRRARRAPSGELVPHMGEHEGHRVGADKFRGEQRIETGEVDEATLQDLAVGER